MAAGSSSPPRSPSSVAAGALLGAPPSAAPPAPPRPAEKKTPAQPRLNTPSGAKAPRAGVSAGSEPGAAAALGKSAWPRSFHVITGASASILRSYPASSSASAPP